MTPTHKFILANATFISIDEIVSIHSHAQQDEKTGLMGYGFAFNLKNGTSVPATSADMEAYLSHVSCLKDVLNASTLPAFDEVGIPQLTPPAHAEHKIVLPRARVVQAPQEAPAE